MERLVSKEIFENFATSAAYIVEYFQNDERDAMLKQLKSAVEQLCITEETMKREKEILASLRSQNNQANGEMNFGQEFETQKSQIVPDPSKNENMIEFERVVKALLEANLEGNESIQDDDELLLTRDTVNLIDPVTKRRMTDPVRNAICGHVYDRASVTGLLSQNPYTRCPVIGCRHQDYLSMANMRSDIVTKTYLDKHPA